MNAPKAITITSVASRPARIASTDEVSSRPKTETRNVLETSPVNANTSPCGELISCRMRLASGDPSAIRA
jgi:hypothetical protein